MKIFIAIITATLFFLVLKVIRLGLKRLLNRFPGLKFSDNITAVTELVLWLVYVFWAVHFLFKGKFFYQYLILSMVLIIMGFMTWFLLKDIFAGIYFRIRYNLKTGSYVHAGDFSGQIKTQKLTYLKLMTSDGHFLRIPYSKIINEVITEMLFPGSLEQHIILVRADISSGNLKTAESLIRTTILNTPWSNLKEEPSIRLLKENEDGYLFEIKLPSINMKQMKYIKMAFGAIPSLQVI